MATFVGIGLALETLTLVAPATIRVLLTQPPLLSSPAGIHDALNPALWTVTGGGLVWVSSCAVVSGEPRKVDLILSAPLPTGTWTVTADNAIQTAGGSPITPPKAMALISPGGFLEPVIPGGANDDAESLLHKHFNPALHGKYWDALLAAIAVGDSLNNKNTSSVFDQLFKTSASGKYLDERSGDDGFQRPIEIGLSDDLFRKLSITVTNTKIVQNVLLEILEIFYGPEATRAHIDTVLSEPFVLHDLDDLNILLDEREAVTVTFKEIDFNQAAFATGSEVAAVITRAIERAGLNAWAVSYKDPAANVQRVRIYSQTLGLKGAVRVTGGKAQNALQFPTKNPAWGLAGTLPTWTITYTPGTQTVRFTQSGSPTQLDLTQVIAGDYVNIYGTEFNALNRGSFPITAVSVSYVAGVLTQWFEIINANGIAEAPVQLAQSSMLFYRPTKETIQNQPNPPAFVSQGNSILDIVMPATTRAVGRGLYSAAYLHTQSTKPISSITRDASGLVTVACTSHGIPVDSATHQVFIDDAVPGTTACPVNAGGVTYTTSSIASTWATVSNNSLTTASYLTVTKLLDNRAVAIGGETSGNVLQNRIEEFYISGVHSSPSGVSYDYTFTANGTLTAAREWHTATLLLDPRFKGSVVIYGGQDAAGNVLTSGEVYTPGAPNSGAGSLTATQALSFARAGHTAVYVPALSKVLLAGGITVGTTATATCELFNPATLTVSNTGSMIQARAAHQMVLLNNGKILVMGGKKGVVLNTLDNGTALATCELYDTGSLTWSATGRMTYSRYGFAAALLPDGKVLVVGGYGYNAVYGSPAGIRIVDAEIYDPLTGLWSVIGKTSANHEYGSISVIGSRAYISGGTSKVVEYLDLNTGKWHISAGQLPFGRYQSKAVLMDQNQIALIGGLNGPTSNEHQLFIPGAEHIKTGCLNGLRTVTAVDANSFTYNTPNAQDYSLVSSGSCVRAAAPLAGGIPGPYIYDPNNGVAISGTSTTTSNDIGLGVQLQVLNVADASSFPDAPGWIAFAFGTANQLGPVHYAGRYSPTALLLDASYHFPLGILAGSTVTLLSSAEPFVPPIPEIVGSFYLTASNAGLAAAKHTMDDVVAAGFTVNKDVEYPGDRGLGGEGRPVKDNYKLSDKVRVWGSDDLDHEVEEEEGV